MIILPDTGGIASTNCYLVADEASKQAVLFDAPDHTVSALLDEASRRGWSLIGLWLTHGHFDHLADHAIVKSRFPDAKILIHRLDEPKMIVPQSKFIPLPFEIPPGKADTYVEEGQKLKIGSLDVEVIHTPGHSPGHVMFHFPKEKVLIGGDLIIMHSVGRTDLPDSDQQQLVESIRRIMKLPRETKLLSGHGEATTLGEEMQHNPIVQSIITSAR